MVLHHLLDLILAEPEIVSIVQGCPALLRELAERGAQFPVRIRHLLCRLDLRETLLRIIAVASYILKVTVKLWPTLAAADATSKHVLAELGFDLVVWNQALLLVLYVLLGLSSHESVSTTEHLGVLLVDEI